MPKIRPLTRSEQERERLKRNLLVIIGGNGKTVSEIAQIIGVSKKTVYNYLEYPENLKIEHILKLQKYLKFSLDDFINGESRVA